MNSIHKGQLEAFVMMNIGIAAPEILQIPVRECGETLILFEDSFDERVKIDDSIENALVIGNKPDFRMRIGVADRIIKAARFLDDHFSLIIKEGYRSLSIQKN